MGSGELTFSPGLGRLLGLPGIERLTVEAYLERIHPDDRERARVEASAVAWTAAASPPSTG